MRVPDDAPNRFHVLRYAELAPLPDGALMVHLRAGHQDALAVLFDRYHRLVPTIALGILRDAGEAKDLVQNWPFWKFFDPRHNLTPPKAYPETSGH